MHSFINWSPQRKNISRWVFQLVWKPLVNLSSPKCQSSAEFKTQIGISVRFSFILWIKSQPWVSDSSVRTMKLHLGFRNLWLAFVRVVFSFSQAFRGINIFNLLFEWGWRMCEVWFSVEPEDTLWMASFILNPLWDYLEIWHLRCQFTCNMAFYQRSKKMKGVSGVPRLQVMMNSSAYKMQKPLHLNPLAFLPDGSRFTIQLKIKRRRISHIPTCPLGTSITCFIPLLHFLFFCLLAYVSPAEKQFAWFVTLFN